VASPRACAVAGTVLLAGVYLLPSATAGQFEPGSVQSRAQSLRTGGFIGGTEATISFGRAIARAQGQQGNAQSQAIDLGLFGFLAAQENGCTGTPVVPPERIPRPLYANSVHGDRSDTRATADGQLVRGGTEYAAATTKPSASSRTDIGVFELPGALALEGMHSTADASITAGAGRRDSSATSAVDAIDLAGGVVRLEGVRWTTSKTTGRGATSAGGFTVGRVLVSGVPLPTETPADLASAFDAAGAVLGPLGLQLEPPTVQRSKDGTLAVTPLVVMFGGNDDANPLVGPLMRQLQPLRDQLYALSQEGGCPVDTGTLNAALTVVDLALAGLTGSGGLILEVGGVRTLHDTRVFESPLGELPPLVVPPPPPPAGVPAGVPTVTRVPGEGRTMAQPGVAGRVSTRCATTHPSGSPGCSDGRAALAGALGLLTVAGLFGADLYRSRRGPNAHAEPQG
jgi:hypothetical protein